MFIYVSAYLLIGLIFSSFLYIKDQITLEDHKIETNFMFYWIFWVILLLFNVLEYLSDLYFDFLDRLSEKIKDTLHK